MEKTNRIDLSSEDRQRLKDLTTSGSMKVRALKRAQILLKADSGSGTGLPGARARLPTPWTSFPAQWPMSAADTLNAA
jgi:hypothetical protein